jgi:hypothetical protein
MQMSLTAMLAVKMAMTLRPTLEVAAKHLGVILEERPQSMPQKNSCTY